MLFGVEGLRFKVNSSTITSNFEQKLYIISSALARNVVLKGNTREQ